MFPGDMSPHNPEGTGSYVRIIDQETGAPTRQITDGLAQPVFIEGISWV